MAALAPAGDLVWEAGEGCTFEEALTAGAQVFRAAAAALPALPRKDATRHYPSTLQDALALAHSREEAKKKQAANKAAKSKHKSLAAAAAQPASQARFPGAVQGGGDLSAFWMFVEVSRAAATAGGHLTCRAPGLPRRRSLSLPVAAPAPAALLGFKPPARSPLTAPPPPPHPLSPPPFSAGLLPHPHSGGPPRRARPGAAPAGRSRLPNAPRRPRRRHPARARAALQPNVPGLPGARAARVGGSPRRRAPRGGRSRPGGRPRQPL